MGTAAVAIAPPVVLPPEPQKFTITAWMRRPGEEWKFVHEVVRDEGNAWKTLSAFVESKGRVTDVAWPRVTTVKVSPEMQEVLIREEGYMLNDKPARVLL